MNSWVGYIMLDRIVRSVGCFALVGTLIACSERSVPVEPVVDSVKPGEAPVAVVDAERIIKADSTPGEWLSHGRTYSEQRFSPLSQINEDTVSELGLAWYADLPTQRGIETTPLMADGKLYVTGSWGHVLAYDARKGNLLWHFDPKVAKDYGRHACCDVVNRGVALWGGERLRGKPRWAA